MISLLITLPKCKQTQSKRIHSSLTHWQNLFYLFASLKALWEMLIQILGRDSPQICVLCHTVLCIYFF